MKISIVILNYNNYLDTIQYVNELLNKQNWENIIYNIVIVDNGSNDNSANIISSQYKNVSNVIVLKSNYNLGFSKGNNLGIVYAKKFFSPDCIVVSNNDISIPNNDFFQKLSNIYLKDSFDVLGPDIYSQSKFIHQSPIRSHYLSTEEIESLLVSIRKKLFVLKLIRPLHIYDLMRKIKKKINTNTGALSGINYQCRQESVVVHGAFFVLSKKYMEIFPEGLYEDLFMYLEEDVLNYRCLLNNLKIIYEPTLSVLHYDGLSTMKKNKNQINKLIFELENTYISAKQILKLFDNQEVIK